MNETTPPIMTINDELLAELEQLAGKATPGPWWIDSHGHNMVSESMDHRLVFTADDRMGKSERNKETGNLSHWPNDWDASFIATANPATILALLQHVRELKADAESYRWIRDKHNDEKGDCWVSVWDKDNREWVSLDKAYVAGFMVFEQPLDLDEAINAARSSAD